MKTAAACLLGALVCVAASAQTTILTWNTPGGTKVSTAGPGDLNGDGVPDVVFGGGGCVTVWSGFDASVIWQACDAPAGLGTSVAVAGDLDLDGYSDIVAAAPGSATVAGYTLILSGASGSMIRTIPTATITVDGGRDFNYDFVPDQLGTYSLGSAPGQSGVHVFSGSSGVILFTVTNASCLCPTPVRAAFVKDVNADGFDDVLVGLPPTTPFGGPATVKVLTGPAGALHTQITGIQAPDPDSQWVTDVGDVTGEGQSDVGIIIGLGNAALAVYDLGAGGTIASAGFLWTYSASVPGFVSSMGNVARFGDLDNDGRTDLVVSTLLQNSPVTPAYPLQIVLTGANGMPVAVAIGTGVTPGHVANAGDLNGDGTLEFVIGFGGASVSTTKVVSWATLPAAPPASSLGGSCGAAPPVLQAGPLRLGQTWSVNLQGAPPAAAVDLVLDIAPPAPVPFGPCTWHPNFAHAPTWLVAPLIMNAGGSATLPIPVPAIPYAAGIGVTMQAIVYGTASPFGFDLSNGMLSFAGF